MNSQTYPLVSFVIPVYGAEKYLNDCIDSIVKQSKIRKEIICVHDESPDNSLEILRAYNSESPGLLNIVDQKNEGGATAINNGLDRATGKFVFILDCDDFIIQDSIHVLVDRLILDESDLVISRIKKFSDEKFYEIYDTNWITRDYVISEENKKHVLFQHGFYTGVLFHRDFLNENKIRMKSGLRIADRPFIALAYAHANKISICNTSICAWRKRNNSDSLSLTDRVYSTQELKDRIETIEYLRATLKFRGFDHLLKFHDKDASRRVIWALRRAWLTGKFIFSYHRFFFYNYHNYYKGLDRSLFSQQHIYSRILSEFLRKDSCILFIAICFNFYLFTQARRTYTALVRAAKFTARTIRSRLPISLARKFHHYIPTYRNSRLYRKYLKIVKPDPSIVLFESNFGKSYSGNPKYIYRYLSENFPDFTSIWVYHDSRLDIDGSPNQVKRGSDEYYYYLCRAKFLVNNIRFPVEHMRKSTIYLQTWHGTPLKMLGYDIPYDGPEAKARESLYRESRHWGYLLSQNAYSTDHFKSAFRYEKEIFELGYPSNDIFYSEGKNKIASDIKKKLRIDDDQKTILYAPTWRDSDSIQDWKFRSQQALDLCKWDQMAKGKFTLLIREHHLVESMDFRENYENNIMNVSEYDDVSELLLITDCLITDYSSIFFDFLNREKPIIFYMHDRKDYETNMRPFYLDIDSDLPGPIATNVDELYDLVDSHEAILESYKEKLLDSKMRFCPNDDGLSSKRVVERLLLGLDS